MSKTIWTRDGGIEFINESPTTLVKDDEKYLEYIKLAYNQWIQTVQNPSDIELGGKLFKNFLINNINNINSEIKSKLNEFYKYIEHENYIKAKKVLDDLSRELGENNPEVVGAKVTLDLESSPLED